MHQVSNMLVIDQNESYKDNGPFTYVGQELFNNYDLVTDFVDPIEELRMTHNNLTNQTLYILSHSPSFSNLKVIDLRENKIDSLEVMMINLHKIHLPALKELYIDVKTKEDDNHTDVTFMFTGILEFTRNLDVLWLKNTSKVFLVRPDDPEKLMNPMPFKRLYLSNFNFADNCSINFIKSLTKVEKLSLEKCRIEVPLLEKEDPYANCINIKSLSLTHCTGNFKFSFYSKSLFNRLTELSLTKLDFIKDLKFLTKFKHLKKLRIARLKLASD